MLVVAVGLPATFGSATGPYVGAQQAKLVPDAIGEEDRFGKALAVDGDRLVLGAMHADGSDGLVFVYDTTGDEPVLEQTISTDEVTIPEPADDAELGSSVALAGDLLVAGASGVDTADEFEAGAAFVFANGGDGWTQLAALPAPDPQALDAFGRTVATDGTHVAVAEPEDEIPGEYSSNGKVHVYEATAEGLVHEASLTPPADDDRERLGVSMAFQNGTLAVGAPQDDTSTGYGAVYVYEETEGTWSQTDRLTAPDDAEAESFGRDVALDGNLLVAGAPGPQAAVCCPTQPVPEGQAHAFALDDGEWTHDGELDPVTSAEGAGVGMSVALDGEQAFVAAPSAPGDTVVGLVHAFTDEGQGWTQSGTVAAEDPASGDRFGQAIEADSGQLLAGAPGDDEAGHQAGAGYLVEDLTLDP